MSLVIAGGAGFIGSKLAEHFLAHGYHVLILDNLCRGKMEYIERLSPQDKLEFFNVDLSDAASTLVQMLTFHQKHPIETVWHMAANSDIPAGIADATVDLKDTFLTTFSLLQAMKSLDIRNLAFASSSAIYGDKGDDTPLHEEIGPLLPISNYGAMKLASEALISAASTWLNHAWIFRFPNVVGVPATHGVILDFVRKLKINPSTLQVLGNGTQQKAYLHVDALVKAMLFIVERSKKNINLYNIGPDDLGCSVKNIAEETVARVRPGAQIVYGMEPRGWVGDVPKFIYSTDRLKALGWTAQQSSVEAVKQAVDEIACQEGV